MAGTLTISTLSDGTNSTSSTNCIQGSAKAWVNFNDTGGTIRASYNVSSVTIPAGGSAKINFTNAMPDANYVICGNTSPDNNGSSSGAVVGMYINTQTSGGLVLAAPTTGYFYVTANWTSSGYPSPQYINVAVFR